MLSGIRATHRGPSLIRAHWHLVAVVVLVAFHAASNWAWLSTNVAILSSDARRHLMTTLTYSDILRQLNMQSLFDVVTRDEFRPPLFHLTAVPFVWLFGRSTDIATMVNGLYMAILVGATYAIGRKMFNAGVAVLAAFVVSTFPAIFAFSRYGYVDFALTAMVALNVALLVYSRNFERKGYSLLYGLSFGLGMLVKWTFCVFALPPAVLVVVRSGVAQKAFRRLRTLRVSVPWALLSASIALVLTLLWYVPNVATVRDMFLGMWLLPLSGLSLALTFYALGRPSSQEANFFGAVLTGLTVSSAWYFPRIDFVSQFIAAVARHSHGSIWGFGGYLGFLLDEQLSLFYVIVLVLAVMILAILHRGQVRALMRREALTSDVALLVSWAAFAFGVFSYRPSNMHSRYTMPMLPPLALLIGWGLLSLSQRRFKIPLLLITVSVALTQFFALSYDGLERVRAGALIELPGAGQVDLFAHGYENQLPNSGDTDSRYWIMPDVLGYMREDSERAGLQGAELGIMMRTHHVQASTFELVSLVEGYSGLRYRELARAWSDTPVYPQLFELDYLVLKDGSQGGINREETKDLVDAFLRADSPFLSEVFEVARRYPLPDGETVYLYRKKYHLTDYNEEDYRAAAQAIASVAYGDEAIIFERPEQIEVFARHYQGTALPYPWPPEPTLDVKATATEMERIAANHDTLLALLWHEEQVDPNHLLEGWLNSHGFPALTSWYGPVRLVAYAAPLRSGAQVQAYDVQARFGPDISLNGYLLDTTATRPGQIVRVTLNWRADGRPAKDYKVFLHLLDAQDRIVAQHDGEPVGGAEPTSGWRAGETIDDNHGLIVPRGTPRGEYRLVLGMYEPETGERLPIARGGETAGDTLALADVVVEETE